MSFLFMGCFYDSTFCCVLFCFVSSRANHCFSQQGEESPPTRSPPTFTDEILGLFTLAMQIWKTQTVSWCLISQPNLFLRLACLAATRQCLACPTDRNKKSKIGKILQYLRQISTLKEVINDPEQSQPTYFQL